MENCRCGAPVKVITLKGSGKNIMVDPLETDKHQFPESERLVTEDGRMVSTSSGDAGYVPHWSSCPLTDSWRKARV